MGEEQRVPETEKLVSMGLSSQGEESLGDSEWKDDIENLEPSDDGILRMAF